MPPSIAIVVMDSVRTDTFRTEFEWLPGTRYERAYSTSHWTLPAHASLLTGLWPRETGTYAGAPSFSPPERSLPERLRDVGYTTRLYTANMQLVQWAGWTDVFDDVVGPRPDLFDWTGAVSDARLPGALVYPEVLVRCILSDVPTWRSLKEGFRQFRGNHELSAEVLRDRFSRRERFDGPEFALFNLMEAHGPYSVAERHAPPERVFAGVGEAIAGEVSEPEAIRRTYRAAVKTLSDRYRGLFDTLEDEFDWVITCSDHGELLGEHGLWGHGFGIYPELVEVPLVVSGPSPGNSTTDELVSLMDIPVTVARLADVNPHGSGHSLLSDDRREVAPVERMGQHHLHREMFQRFGIGDQFDTFDIELRGVARRDGGYAYETREGVETDDWAGGVPEDVIEATFEGVERYAAEEESVVVSPEAKERLQDLGYA